MQGENGKRGWEASYMESDGRGPVQHGRLGTWDCFPSTQWASLKNLPEKYFSSRLTIPSSL